MGHFTENGTLLSEEKVQVTSRCRQVHSASDRPQQHLPRRPVLWAEVCMGHTLAGFCFKQLMSLTFTNSPAIPSAPWGCRFQPRIACPV